jgi:hypothetical protein
MIYFAALLWIAICLMSGGLAFSKAWRTRQRDLGQQEQRMTPAIQALSARWFGVLTFNVIGWVYGAAQGAQSLTSLLQTQTDQIWNAVQLVTSIGLQILVFLSLWKVTTLRTTVQGPIPLPRPNDEPN